MQGGIRSSIFYEVLRPNDWMDTLIFEQNQEGLRKWDVELTESYPINAHVFLLPFLFLSK